ncbi:hypothetical protein [Pseudomonas sp. MF4836]|uniref:hypothetical protein n=1 Tax=Pseudomonas sp. MF4836 TaxID=1960827 RepID=UPI000998D127|nr:hypothetical protein [Pseudomonas sp. MF4836]OOV90583.1 hypothetical protein MF4836_30255 [Pseudomonas sp. MF4836]
MQHIIQVDNTFWALISRLQGKELQTPSRSARFRITTVDANRVVIEAGSEDSRLALTRTAAISKLWSVSCRQLTPFWATEYTPRFRKDDYSCTGGDWEQY